MIVMHNLPAHEHICDITENVWTGFLDLPLARRNAQERPCEYESCIRVEGAWNGEVRVACSRQLAQRVATAMFHSPGQDICEEFCVDALNEIANIIGGNVKALLPSPSRLGLPAFHHGEAAGGVGQVVHFNSDGEPLRVQLVEDAD
ncbi:MAG: chemotaxis protein CheX [Moraxellaceae bacterium]